MHRNLEEWFFKLGNKKEVDEIFVKLHNLAITEKKKIVPKKEDVFKALELTPFKEVRVVWLGQDPYPQIINGVPVAHGLAFSSNVEEFRPKSLENIFTEIENNLYDGFNLNISTRSVNLEDLAKQGVLLLNTSLTTFVNEPGAHLSIWNEFVLKIIQTLNEQSSGIIFCLWGNHAKKYEKYINTKSHYILTSGHPSPLSANKGHWFGNNHFKMINQILKENNGEEFTIKYC